MNKEFSEDYHLKYEYINDGLHYNDEGLLVLRNYRNGKNINLL